MTEFDFTKVKWAGSDMILVTVREHSKEPIALFSGENIQRLNQAWMVGE